MIWRKLTENEQNMLCEDPLHAGEAMKAQIVVIEECIAVCRACWLRRFEVVKEKK